MKGIIDMPIEIKYAQPKLRTYYPMKSKDQLIIYRDRNKYVWELLIILPVVVFVPYVYFTDNSISNSDNLFWLIIIATFCYLLFRYAYNFFDKRPMYIFTKQEVYVNRRNKSYSWMEFNAYKIVETRNKYGKSTEILFLDKDNNTFLNLDITYSATKVTMIDSYLQRRLSKQH